MSQHTVIYQTNNLPGTQHERITRRGYAFGDDPEWILAHNQKVGCGIHDDPEDSKSRDGGHEHHAHGAKNEANVLEGRNCCEDEEEDAERRCSAKDGGDLRRVQTDGEII